jgi:hypothetical protein
MTEEGRILRTRGQIITPELLSKQKGKNMVGSTSQKSAPHLLVVIDHQEAKIYHIEVEGIQPVRILPFDPHGHRETSTGA